MSGLPKVISNPFASAQDVRDMANIGYAHGTSMAFLEIEDILGLLTQPAAESRSFEENFALRVLKRVPPVCLSCTAHLPLLSLFQQCFYSSVYDGGLKRADGQSHALFLESQQLLGELLFNEESKISVKELTKKILDRLSREDAAWIGAMTNFFSASHTLLNREQLPILKGATEQLVDVPVPFTLPEQLVFTLNKLKLNLMTLEIHVRKLQGCFDELKCSLKECFEIFQQNLPASVQPMYALWSQELHTAFHKLLKDLKLLSGDYLELFSEVAEVLTEDADPKSCATFVKKHWKQIDGVHYRLMRVEPEALADLSKVLELVTCLRFVDRFLHDNPQLEIVNNEQWRFTLLQGYSQLANSSDPNSCWKVAVAIRDEVKSKANPKEWLKASLCLYQVHKFLCQLRPLVKSALGLPCDELSNLFSYREQLIQDIEKSLGTDKIIAELLAIPTKKRDSTPQVVVDKQIVKPQETVEEETAQTKENAEPRSFADMLLHWTDDLHQSIRSLSFTVSAYRRQFLKNAALKLSLLSAELLLGQGEDKHRDYHTMTVAKYIHGMLQEVLTAMLLDPTTRAHSLVELAKACKVDKYAELFLQYDKAGALSRRPEKRDEFSVDLDIFSVLEAFEELLKFFGPISKQIQREDKLLKVKNAPSPKESPLRQKIAQFQGMIKVSHPGAKQCYEHAFWNLEMLAYRFEKDKEASLAVIDLLANECFDLFHTISELVLRGYMIERKLYQNEHEAHLELNHSLQAHVSKANIFLSEELQSFVKEYDQVSFVRYVGFSPAVPAASLAKETRKAASLQRRFMGQQGYAELNQVWEELEREIEYDRFEVSATRSTKKALETYRSTLKKLQRDSDLLLKLLGECL